MEQGYIPQRNLQQGMVLGWTQQSVLSKHEAYEASSQSASSAVISPACCDNGDVALSESSRQSSSSLKERDYIGLAEVSSAPSVREPEVDAELNLAETDLRLGLGPTVDALEDVPEFLLSSTSTSQKSQQPVMTLHVKDDVGVIPSMHTVQHSVSSKSLVGATPMLHVNGVEGTLLSSVSKNGGKRMYADAMANVSLDVRSTTNLKSASGTVSTSDPRVCNTTQIMSMKQFHDPEMMANPLHHQSVFWAPTPHVPSWQSQGTFCSVASQKGTNFPSIMGEKDIDASRNVKIDMMYGSGNTWVQSVADEENASDTAPPAKGQVVGWPPVRSYRRDKLVTRTKPPRDEGDGHSAVYVKVNMEGIPIGRKVDLNTYKSYDSLLSALEDMFHNHNSGLGVRFLKGSEYVLTYEDKDGDWMLVGDVPWGMFVNTVRRLRITRGSDMTGLGSRTCRA